MAGVVINEILPDPSGPDADKEWIELYNTSGAPVDLDGYVLEDRQQRRIILSGIIDKWLVIYPKKENSFAVTNSGETTIKLFETESDVVDIDSFLYNGSSKDKSWGRYPDGGEIYSEKMNPTPQLANQIPPTPTAEPTSAPTAEPTAEPTSASTPAPPTSLPTRKPTIRPVRTTKPQKIVIEDLPENENESLVLGVQDSDTPSPTPNETGKGKVPITAIGFMLGGLGFVAFAGYNFFVKGEGEYNKGNGKDIKRLIREDKEV